MAKKHIIYKQDNWNMMTVEAEGAKITVREISTEWGEDTYIFTTRHEMMEWAKSRFLPEDYVGREDDYNQIMESFKNI
ncbi:hypothetical protein [Aneurinibacillus terranovensis]|uniref:hypothetical protein n=1 Tax=Aneurinibacillus terranovensis TaxID=278991 RepID=UPI000488D35F|nr:hypothetical protein [Aneurinibacillus terranovensis]